MLLVLVITVVLGGTSLNTDWRGPCRGLVISLGLVVLVGALHEETLKGLVVAVKEVVAPPARSQGNEATVDAWMASLSVGGFYFFVHMVSAMFAYICTSFTS